MYVAVELKAAIKREAYVRAISRDIRPNVIINFKKQFMS